MEDGQDRARRDTSGRPGGRRSAVRDESSDDVLARHGLLGDAAPPAGGRSARRRATEDAEQHRDGPSPDDGGGRRRRPEPQQAPDSGVTGRCYARAPERPASGQTDRRPEPPATGNGGRRHRPDDRDGQQAARNGHRSTGADPWASAAPRQAERRDPPGPATHHDGHDAGGRRRRAEPGHDGRGHDGDNNGAARHGRPAPVERRPPGEPWQVDPGQNRTGHNPSEQDQRTATGRHGRPLPPPVKRQEGGRRRHVEDPGPAPPDAFIDDSTARGRAAMETSGALERTQAIAPGWVSTRADGDAEATTRLPPRTPAVPVIDGPTGLMPARDRPSAAVDEATRQVRRDEAGVAEDAADEAAEEAAEEQARVARIDETLTRLTAAHAGLVLATDDDPVDDEPPPPRVRLTPLRLVCLVLAIAVLGAAGVGAAARGWLNRGVPEVSALDEKSTSIVDAAAQSGATNVLIVANEHEPVPGTAPTGHGPGTVAIAHVPAGGGPLTVLVLPANLEINRPPCERYDPIGHGYSDQPVPAEARTQLSSALSVGGPRCVTRVVQQLTGLAVTSYVGIDLDELGGMVGRLGGVDVCVPRPVVDPALGPIMPTAGDQRLDGERAGDFLRAGDVSGDEPAGLGSIERQQGVLAAVLRPVLSTTGLLDIGQLAATRPGLGAALSVDGLDLDQVLATARSLTSLDADGVAVVAAPTATEPNGRGNVVLRDADAAALFAAVRTDQPLPTTAGSATVTGPQPGDNPVQVLNASDRVGLADKVGDTLSQLGFAVGDVGNAPQRTPQTVIRFSPDMAAAAELLAASVPSATSVPDPGSTGVLQLVIGRSFDDVVRPPVTPAADAVAPGQAAAPAAQCG